MQDKAISGDQKLLSLLYCTCLVLPVLTAPQTLIMQNVDAPQKPEYIRHPETPNELKVSNLLGVLRSFTLKSEFVCCRSKLAEAAAQVAAPAGAEPAAGLQAQRTEAAVR